MNTALIIHLMFRVMKLVQAGHLTHPILWIGCFSRPAAQTITHLHAAGCMVVRMAPHSAKVSW